MSNSLVVDFHVHSTASDGTEPPSRLAAMARSFAAMAVTDHDNCDGIAEYLTSEKGPARRIAGVELSIEPGNGFDKFHLLGLGIDSENSELQSFLRRILEGRNARNVRIVENFNRLGIEMRLEDLDDYAHGEVLARPHFAKWLVDHGLATDIPSAFDAYLLPDSPSATRCYEERWHPSQEDAFRAVHGAGGLCVMAHPRYWRSAWKTIPVDYEAAGRELARLKEAGLDGIESLYQANTMEENIRFTRLADELKLLKSAGSDFHGKHKPAVTLGMTVDESFISPLLDALLD